MSQPEKGGATVYTELGSGVFPTLNDALFWYNLKRDGEGDLRTRHAVNLLFLIYFIQNLGMPCFKRC